VDYKIIIDNSQNNNTLTDYQVMVKITDPAFFSKCTEQKFVEFYDEDKQTLLNHWTEKFDTVNNEAIFWVKVPSIPANGTKTIYLKINTSRTEDLSNGANTFEDFRENLTVQGQIWYSNKTVKYIIFVAKATTEDKSWWDIGLDNKAGDIAVFRRPVAGGMYAQVRNEGNVTEKSITPHFGTHVYEIRWKAGSAKFYIDGNFMVELTTNVPDEPCYPYFQSADTNPKIIVAYYYVRKYTEPEPTVTVVPIAATPTLEFKKRVAECIVTENCKINEADPKLELYDSGGNLIKTLSLADKHIFKDESNNRVVVQFLFVDDSSDSYTSESQKLKFTKGGSEYVAFEASETLEKTADEPLPLRWEIYIPYTLDIELEGEY